NPNGTTTECTEHTRQVIVAQMAAVATPSVSPNGGSHIGPINVSLSTQTAGATIRYTTNDTPVTVESSLYSNPLELSGNTTLRVRAFKSGMSPSEEIRVLFFIPPPPSFQFNVPAFDDDGNFDITWSGARTYAALYEQVGNKQVSLTGGN